MITAFETAAFDQMNRYSAPAWTGMGLGTQTGQTPLEMAFGGQQQFCTPMNTGMDSVGQLNPMNAGFGLDTLGQRCNPISYGLGLGFSPKACGPLDSGLGWGYSSQQCNPMIANPFNPFGQQSWGNQCGNLYGSYLGTNFGHGNQVCGPQLPIHADFVSRAYGPSQYDLVNNTLDHQFEQQIKLAAEQLIRPRLSDVTATKVINGAPISQQEVLCAVAGDRSRDAQVAGLIRQVINDRRLRRHARNLQRSGQGIWAGLPWVNQFGYQNYPLAN